ncbi:BPK_HP2_G0026760.mRNA.1.CDS.1 [Saccharomyces cerevisiae]|nr:CRB_1a_G0030320.mRNA.1.CDS.1 [Saccharomyces cerevisiae]CAI5283832.1 BPK_HP2_G0026760.mRNA.1.CDS.1 [Saccharomyces cerevisiae]CAI6569058.1 BPK_HP2_G0026760.mRNA.1.CDS.1 [Saccharomyces cerevisiae]CAI6836399.1 BPK_HP1_G0028180.mRNA.1.CDS.1 [Saccharomyces cerevisiae]CAI7364644.1 CRB_1a_G0030320.mRNA.1.CDS.1 [Saccharomyces cerevisiae]
MKFDNDSEKQVFDKLKKAIPGIIKEKCAGYDELYGYKLNPEGLTQEEVDKYYDEKIADRLTYKLCKAYQFEYSTIVQNLIDILNWRREFNPLSCAYKEVHNTELQNVGILTFDANGDANKKAVTWNLYGQLVKKKELFQNVDKFVRYRIGLMERGLSLLDFTSSDNNYMTQVHDYKGVSVWRMDSDIKNCSKTVIGIFQKYYPELLYAKYFVNVPTVFGWVYDLIKKFVDETTRKKFVVLTDGSKLGQYLKDCPYEGYGGKDKKNNLTKQNVTNVHPTEYGLYILQKQIIEDVE